jgi:hypothetical protein
VRASSVFLVATVALLAPAGAKAQLTYVGPSCEFFMGVSILNQFVPAAQACAGAFSGNDVHYQTEIQQLIASSGWGAMSYQGTTDSGQTSGPFSSVPGGTNGALVFDSPLTGDYVFVLKSATKFSLYYFSGLVGATELYFVTSGTSLNPRGTPQGLSHASLWAGPPVSVPEPAAGLLLLTAMIGMAGVARRRRELA